MDGPRSSPVPALVDRNIDKAGEFYYRAETRPHGQHEWGAACGAHRIAALIWRMPVKGFCRMLIQAQGRSLI
jgi:hypothetical protein